MNLRPIIRPMAGPLLALLLAPCAGGEQVCRGDDESRRAARATANGVVPIATGGCDKAAAKPEDASGVSPRPGTELPTRAEFLRQVAVYETAVRKAQSAHASDVTLAKMYGQLATYYGNAGMYELAEAALEHAIPLWRGHAESSRELADDMDYLGSVHGVMGKLRQAEHEELESVRLWEGLGDSLGTARSWSVLSGIYFRQRKYEISMDFARKAVAEFSTNGQADFSDKVAARLNLAQALCHTKECPSAIPVLKDTVTMAKLAFRANDFPVGEAEFLLGFAYWKTGDVAGASEFMKHGVAIMKEQLGWGHPAYLNSLSNYAQFLRENRRVDDAEVVERQIRQTQSVVDVHSIQKREGVDSLAGLR
jgi:tetratricopeptide (TPR) repeat protein